MSAGKLQPENMVSLRTGAFGVPMNDAELAIIGKTFSEITLPEDNRTAAEKYADHHRDMMVLFAAGDDMLLPTDDEMQRIEERNPYRWQRLSSAATRALSSQGEFPLLAELGQPTIQEVAPEEAAVIPLPRSETVLTPEGVMLRASA